MIQVLLSLRENNQERVKIDPRIQLAALYREIREMLNDVDSMEKKLEQLSRNRQDLRSEQDQLVESKPVWMAEIESAKEKIIRQRGYTLKDMLGIQQEVVRLEEAMRAADARIEELHETEARILKARRQIQSKLTGLKGVYNQHAEVYNQEKAKADVLMDEYALREDSLLEELDPAGRSVYREALRLNPENPVVLMDGDICGGCKIGLSRQQVKYVNQGGKLVSCENCLRIILPIQDAD